MTKATKYYTLFTALKSSGKDGASPESLALAMGFKLNSVAPYVHALRHKFDIKIKSIRNGRNVVKYMLAEDNTGEVTETGFKRGRKAASATKTVAKKAPIVAKKATKKPIKDKKAKAVKLKPEPKKVFTPKPEKVVAPDADLHISEFNDRELMDLREQLGIS